MRWEIKSPQQYAGTSVKLCMNVWKQLTNIVQYSDFKTSKMSQKEIPQTLYIISMCSDIQDWYLITVWYIYMQNIMNVFPEAVMEILN